MNKTILCNLRVRSCTHGFRSVCWWDYIGDFLIIFTLNVCFVSMVSFERPWTCFQGHVSAVRYFLSGLNSFIDFGILFSDCKFVPKMLPSNSQFSLHNLQCSFF